MTAPATPRKTDAPADGRDWTNQAAQTVESLVLTVKEKTTVPAQTIARAVVYGLVLAVVAVVALVALVIGVVRLIDVEALGWAGRVHGHHRLWIAYLAVGLILSFAGLFLWSKRTVKGRTA